MHAENRKDPRSLFLQLFSILALYIGFSSLLSLLFNFIDLKWGEIGYFTSIWGMRLELSTLLISFVAYSWSCYQIRKNAMPAHKFLVYLTLFLVGILLAGDAISLLYNLLSGELTTAFVLKVLVLFLLSAGVAYFYFVEARQGNTPKQFKAYLWAATVLVTASLAWALYTVGSPVKVRLANQDMTRISNLNQIQNQISSYYKHKNKLPASLSDLNNAMTGYKAPMDPVSNKAYAYQVISAQSFELCADFALPSSNAAEKMMGNYYGAGAWNWQHEAGHSCFIRKIDPQWLN
ncbi:MAG: hypothetical protein K0S29_570 [Gammaproteobacteria bacterium]|jgi:hypothetical protein|nr:hypothetical protein [Gammaproteobacteria bacterium]